MHSNYDSGVPIQIRIHENLVLISNDCIFPANWTAETLMQRHRSEQYNPKIANAFFRAGYVEAWGRGIENMCKLCADNAVKTEYTVHPCDVMLEFSIPQLEISEKRPNVAIGMWPEKWPEKWPENAKKIIQAMANDQFVTITELENLLAVGHTTVKKMLQEMRKEGYIRRVGPDKGGHWQIMKNVVP
jgi:ATP-dependent DNA helicase RecG